MIFYKILAILVAPLEFLVTKFDPLSFLTLPVLLLFIVYSALAWPFIIIFKILGGLFS